VCATQVTFYFIRRHRLRAFPRGLGYTLLHGGEAGMSPAELRALPVRPLPKLGISRLCEGYGRVNTECTSLESGTASGS